jgi:hypothetical protein
VIIVQTGNLTTPTERLIRMKIMATKKTTKNPPAAKNGLDSNTPAVKS